MKPNFYISLESNPSDLDGLINNLTKKDTLGEIPEQTVDVEGNGPWSRHYEDMKNRCKAKAKLVAARRKARKAARSKRLLK